MLEDKHLLGYMDRLGEMLAPSAAARAVEHEAERLRARRYYDAMMSDLSSQIEQTERTFNHLLDELSLTIYPARARRRQRIVRMLNKVQP